MFFAGFGLFVSKVLHFWVKGVWISEEMGFVLAGSDMCWGESMTTTFLAWRLAHRGYLGRRVLGVEPSARGPYVLLRCARSESVSTKEDSCHAETEYIQSLETLLS